MTRCLSRLLIAVLALAAGAAQAAGPRLVVRPLEIYNAPDVEALAPGLQAMLASRLAGAGFAVETAKAREPGDEAWAVRTTITRLGAVLSVDAALEPVTARGEGTRTYETAPNAEALLPALEKVAARLKEALARAPAAAAPAPPAPRPAPASAPLPPALAIEAQLALALRNHRIGPEVSGEARALAVADADRDGAAEILLLLDDAIVAFRDTAGELVRAWDSPVPRGFAPKDLSAGDIDGNGVPELFVAGMDGTRPVSQALEWFGSALAPKGDRMAAFVRALRHPERGELLLGRVAGVGQSIFAAGTYAFEWTGSRYEKGETFPAPSAAAPVNLDFALLEAGKGPFAAVTTPDERLRLYGPDGEEVFETTETVKGTRTLLLGADPGGRGNLDEDVYRVQAKTVAWPGPDGVTHLLLSRNHATLGRLFSRSPMYSQGQILAFRWDGLSLVPEAEGPRIPSFLVGLGLGPASGGPPRTLYAALVKTEGTLFRTMKSRVLAYELPSAGPALAR